MREEGSQAGLRALRFRRPDIGCGLPDLPRTQAIALDVRVLIYIAACQ